MAILKTINEWIRLIKFAWPVLVAIPYAKYETYFLSLVGPNSIILLRIAFLSVTLVLILLTLTLFLWRKLHLNLKFDPEVGAYSDSKGIWYCTSCKTKGTLAPLRKTKDHELICQVATCKQLYYLPEYKPTDTDWNRLYDS